MYEITLNSLTYRRFINSCVDLIMPAQYRQLGQCIIKDVPCLADPILLLKSRYNTFVTLKRNIVKKKSHKPE